MQNLTHKSKNITIYPAMPKLRTVNDWWNGSYDSNSKLTLIYVLDGMFPLIIEDHSYIIQKQQMVLIPGNRPNAYWGLPNMATRILCFNFYAECEGINFIDFFGIGDDSHVVSLPDKEAEIMEIYEHMTSPDYIPDTMPHYILMCAELAKLCAIYMQARVSLANAKTEFQNVIDYMRAHLTEDIPLETLAASMHLNASYFSAKFKEQMGVSPMKYLAQMRTKEAAKLLRNTDMSVAAVGKKIGFSDMYYFRTFFEKHLGLRPEKYRDIFLSKIRSETDS